MKIRTERKINFGNRFWSFLVNNRESVHTTVVTKISRRWIVALKLLSYWPTDFHLLFWCPTGPPRYCTAQKSVLAARLGFFASEVNVVTQEFSFSSWTCILLLHCPLFLSIILQESFGTIKFPWSAESLLSSWYIHTYESNQYFSNCKKTSKTKQKKSGLQ